MKRQNGFTLIEVMVVVVIVGILASIAIPNYDQYVRRSRRAEGTEVLATYNSRMAHYYLDNNVYGPGNSCAIAAPTPKYFDFACVSASAQAYTATVTGRADANISDTSYTINQADAKTSPTYPSRTNAPCWLVSGKEC